MLNSLNTFDVPDNDLLNKFEVDKEIRDKYTDIKNFARVDFQAFDKLLETKDTLYKEIELDKDFHDYIMNGMPDGATDIEKAVFVYLKMCRTLSYDEEFYARNQPADMHSSIDLVQHINLDNKDVVCYEFNLMYAKFLDELGIKGRTFWDLGALGKPDNFNRQKIDYSSKIRQSVGFGFDWMSPMGKINIDFGFPIVKERYDETEVFRLNFGTSL